RESVFNGLVYSQEFRAICASYGFTRLIDPSRPMVALTFDDGPGARTDEIITALEQTNQAATFFVVGISAELHPNTLRHMSEAGCEIGNHTYDHQYLTRLGAEGIAGELSRNNDLIRAATGHDATLIRPPGGSHNATVDALVNAPIILWSIDTRDWQTRSTQSTINSVLSNVSDGDIILMHDIHSSTVDAALYLIPELQRRGYQLVTVSELARFRGGMTNGAAYRRFRP
ncbi:MAG: polysaccharide deacetylase family protein, partial [Clostridiales bacterium]|nr:polysaccharide deacetylase family protein [Clostridiales bacterium]